MPRGLGSGPGPSLLKSPTAGAETRGAHDLSHCHRRRGLRQPLRRCAGSRRGRPGRAGHRGAHGRRRDARRPNRPHGHALALPLAGGDVVEATPEADPDLGPDGGSHVGAHERAHAGAHERAHAGADRGPGRDRHARRRPTATAAPKLGVDKSQDRKRREAESRPGQLGREVRRRTASSSARVVDPSTSTSGRECASRTRTRSATSGRRGRPTTTAPSPTRPAPSYRSDGTPTPANPSYSLATPGPAPIGVPNFFIEKFRIPPFLLPIYQAAGIQYGVRWEVLAAINEIETDYGRNLNISSAGALGWMQFMPATWDAYGVDANGDGEKDPFNPVDAIFAAARYLRAAGADTDLYRAIFAYNHADWYVESVLMRARVIGGLPADLVGSLTGLTQGRFPVAAKATYAGALPDDERDQARSSRARTPPRSSSPTARAARSASSAASGAPVVAVQDGRVIRIGHSRKLGNFVELQDSYGNTYLYSGLGELAEAYPFPKAAQGEAARARAARGRRRAASAPPRATKADRRAPRRASRARSRPTARRPSSACARPPRQPLPRRAAGQGAPVRQPRAGRTPAPPAARTSSRVIGPAR